MPALPHVPTAQAHAFVLQRQGLSGAGHDTVAAILDASGGVYGTSPTCALGCIARSRSFRLGDLATALYEARSAVRLRAMRESVYVVPVATVDAIVAATNPAKERVLKRQANAARMTHDAFLAFADRLYAALDGAELTTAQLRAAIPDVDRRAFSLGISWLCRTQQVVRAHARGGWRSDGYRYARWTDWLGVTARQIDPAQARVDLARRYLHAFGPASPEDLRWWAGWNKTDTTAALAALGADVTRVEVPDVTDAHVLASDLDDLLATDPDSARGAYLLPVWDALPMGYAQRGRWLDPRHRELVYDRFGNGTSILLLDGRAAGVWEVLDSQEPPGGTVTVRVAPFGARMRWKDVERAAQRIATAIGADALALERCPPTSSLVAAPQNAFLAPIKATTA